MLHRGLITISDVETILRIADYPPYFIDKLIKIAYLPFTRVDVRRMYQMGVLSEAELITAYKDIGYDEEKAKRLTEFTVRFETKDDRDLTKSEIMKLYEIGLIDRETCHKELLALRYEAYEADYLITLVEYRQEKEGLDDKIATLVDEFLIGFIDEDKLIGSLDALNLPSTQRERITTRAFRTKLKELKMPSKEDIIRWNTLGLITEAETRKLFTRINIPEEFHNYYLGKKEG